VIFDFSHLKANFSNPLSFITMTMKNNWALSYCTGHQKEANDSFKFANLLVGYRQAKVEASNTLV
jgi:hypothetical protein